MKLIFIKLKNRYLIFSLFLFVSLFAKAQYFQPLSSQQEDQIATLKELAEGYEKQKEYQNASNSLNNIAIIYWQNGYLEEAINTYLKSAELNNKINNNEYLKSIYSNIGVIYTDMEKVDKALEYFKMSLTVRRQMQNNEYIASGLIDVAYILTIMKEPEESIKYLQEALAIATDDNKPNLILNCYQMLANNYQDVGNLKKSNEYASKSASYEVFVKEQGLKEEFKEKDIASQAEIKKTSLELQTEQMQSQLRQLKASRAQDSLNFQIRAKRDSLIAAEARDKQKQREIEYLNAQQELKAAKQKELEADAARQKTIIYAGIGILVLVIVLAYVMFRSYRQQQTANKKLEEQNVEIARQRDDIKSKSAELEDALDLITLQAQNITKSINYAQGIQEALLPKIEDLDQFLTESFILFLPRDIVSGDYYWYREVDRNTNIYKALNVFEQMQLKAKQNEEQELEASGNGEEKDFVIAAVDCTGHGVPGAFMSMIGFNLLDEIVERGISRSDLILDELHKGVRRTLKQDVTENRDGMDMALCILRRKENIIEYSGAKNPLLYIQDGEVFTIKGDKTPIGGLQTENQRKFLKHEIKIDKPTSFYIFSDGYIDQFGGPDGRKFLIKNFRDLLLAYHDQSMEEQKKVLHKAIEDWKGNKFKQIDDILVIGFKVEPTKKAKKGKKVV